MAELKSGKTATEWITVGAVILFGAAKMFGIVPLDATPETIGAQATEALPILLNGIIDLARQNSSLMVMAGLAWAYLRRRSDLKSKQINAKQ